MDKLSEAICFATCAFDGMVRKGERQSTIFHSLEAAVTVQMITDDQDVVIASVLHDTIEDAGVTPEQIEERFGKRVRDLVMAETEDKHREMSASDSWLLRKQTAVEHLKNTDDMAVKALFLGDKLSNLRALYRSKVLSGEKMWQVFNQKDPKMHKWYYESILACLSEYKGTLVYGEFEGLVEKVFEGV